MIPQSRSRQSWFTTFERVELNSLLQALPERMVIYTTLSDHRSVMDISWMQLSTCALTNARPAHPGLRNHRLHHTAVGWPDNLPCGVSLFSLPRAVAYCGGQNVQTRTPINVFHVIISRHYRSCPKRSIQHLLGFDGRRCSGCSGQCWKTALHSQPGI